MTSNSVGKRLPSISGETLSHLKVRFPENLVGSPTVLLVAYRRGTQQDLDRWIEFLSLEAPELVCYEVAAIPSLIWRPLAVWIDAGMRGGVPKEKWSRVVTLYDDAAKLRDFIGDSGENLTHVLALDKHGTVLWFDSKGFSEKNGAELLDALKKATLD